ncbi:SOS response-associated peptidase family protein [Psychroserpens sp. Hel_I_66]|uniref:SOS response-associated peptidase family protein n=1 Tax=Psychroserpens sp. Hel_I_66 TaxID=1250004 RepID=UPI0006895271|nr:SOS response-associated peptidase family protein [Psychroserpens sp. Hel_I_66]
MFYKLSNTCDVLEIEKEFGTTFRYPNLYKPKAIIDGLKESQLPIITSQNLSHVDYSIWGLLPEGYDDNWNTFQDFTNTLNTNIQSNDLNEEIYSDSLDKRRCLVIVNGFFSTKISDGKLRTHLIHLKNQNPFCIAGIYNKILDGFYTCSILTTNSVCGNDHIPGLEKQKPLIFKKKDLKRWLDPKLTIEHLKPLVQNHEHYDFISQPINESFYNNSKLFSRTVNSSNEHHIMRISRD